jgi:hypothetical protein
VSTDRREDSAVRLRVGPCDVCGIQTSCQKVENIWYCHVHTQDVKDVIIVEGHGADE